ncbi:MAG: hypothetical protein ACOCVR_02945 [Myxococcota bacterium]
MLPMTVNNPAVALTRRRWLRRLMNEGLLTEDMLDLLGRVVEHANGVSPCGAVHDIALGLGASPERSLRVAALAELFYAVCSFTDDIQDGDAGAYLGEVPLSRQINTQSHLLCFIAVCLDELFPGEQGRDLLVELYRTGALMLQGQDMELTRVTWDVERYHEVALLSGGHQFALYFQLAAEGAEQDGTAWSKLGLPFGSLLQMGIDLVQQDERLLLLPMAEVESLAVSLIADVRAAAEPLGALGARIAEYVLSLVPEALAERAA